MAPVDPSDSPAEGLERPDKARHADRHGRREPEINKLFRMVVKYEASDLHLKAGQPPMIRLRRDIRRLEMRPLTQEDMERLLAPLLSERHRKALEGEGGVVFCYSISDD